MPPSPPPSGGDPPNNNAANGHTANDHTADGHASNALPLPITNAPIHDPYFNPGGILNYQEYQLRLRGAHRQAAVANGNGNAQASGVQAHGAHGAQGAHAAVATAQMAQAIAGAQAALAGAQAHAFANAQAPLANARRRRWGMRVIQPWEMIQFSAGFIVGAVIVVLVAFIGTGRGGRWAVGWRDGWGEL